MNTLTYAPLFVTAALLLQPLAAQEEDRTVLALWTFEEWTEEQERSGAQEIGPISPEVGSGSLYGFHSDPDTIWKLVVGHGSEQALNSHRWTAGDYYEFEVSTLGFESIHLDWNMTRSKTGPEDWLLGYSLDGTDFTTVDTFTLGTSEWRSGSAPRASIYEFDLSSVADLNDQPNAFFRLIAAVDGETTGAVRTDNFSVTATPIPEPATVGMLIGLVAVGAAAGGRIRRQRKLQGSDSVDGA